MYEKEGRGGGGGGAGWWEPGRKGVKEVGEKRAGSRIPQSGGTQEKFRKNFPTFNYILQ